MIDTINGAKASAIIYSIVETAKANSLMPFDYVAQVMEAWESLWKKVKQSREQKHRRILESWKQDKLKEYTQEIERGFQIRFG